MLDGRVRYFVVRKGVRRWLKTEVISWESNKWQVLDIIDFIQQKTADRESKHNILKLRNVISRITNTEGRVHNTVHITLSMCSTRTVLNISAELKATEAWDVLPRV